MPNLSNFKLSVPPDIYPNGEARRALMNGETELSDFLPVNASGGLKARRHPIEAGSHSRTPIPV